MDKLSVFSFNIHSVYCLIPSYLYLGTIHFPTLGFSSSANFFPIISYIYIYIHIYIYIYDMYICIMHMHMYIWYVYIYLQWYFINMLSLYFTILLFFFAFVYLYWEENFVRKTTFRDPDLSRSLRTYHVVY